MHSVCQAPGSVGRLAYYAVISLNNVLVFLEHLSAPEAWTLWRRAALAGMLCSTLLTLLGAYKACFYIPKRLDGEDCLLASAQVAHMQATGTRSD
jgi:hypothetical protein